MVDDALARRPSPSPTSKAAMPLALLSQIDEVKCYATA